MDTNAVYNETDGTTAADASRLVQADNQRIGAKKKHTTPPHHTTGQMKHTDIAKEDVCNKNGCTIETGEMPGVGSNVADGSDDMRFDLLNADQSALDTYVTQTLHQPRYRAQQLSVWLTRGVPFSEMDNLPRTMRDQMAQTAYLALPKTVQKQVSRIDGTVKFLFAYPDGATVESVLMRYYHGNTLCISTQVGCRMGCRFCASTIGGKVRDLTASEMLGEVLVAGRETGVRVDGIVLMGIGEPLDNYDNTIRFLHLVSRPGGLNIGLRHISLSTCGVVPGMLRLADEGLPITLSLSLHAPTDEQRSAIMPVNRKWNIAQVLAATVNYFEKTKRRVSFEYTLIHGENDTPQTALSLVHTLQRHVGKRMPLHVNLIPVNPVSERTQRAGDMKSIQTFAAILRRHGINATVRRKLGADIDAACGQLRRRVQTESMTQTTTSV